VYEIEWSDAARTDFRGLSVFVRGPIVTAIEHLRHEAEIETRNRKRLQQPLDALADAEWTVRVGDSRVLYQVRDKSTVRVLRVILKGTRTTEEALARSLKP